MKKPLCAALALIMLGWNSLTVQQPAYADNKKTTIETSLQTGDIIAHKSKSRQSRFIKALTGSDYTHIGFVVKKGGQSYVLEAIEPVKYTKLSDWINRGEGKKYTVKRLNSDYQQCIPQIIQRAEGHLGKHYDAWFHPSDKKIYCSELISKAVKNGFGIQLGEWETLDEIAGWKGYLPQYQKEAKRRWGKYPKDLKMITPASIMQDDTHLSEIYSNF